MAGQGGDGFRSENKQSRIFDEIFVTEFWVGFGVGMGVEFCSG